MTQATDEAGQQEGLTQQASAKAHDAAAVAQEKAAELRDQGSARLRDQFDQRSSQAGAQVRSLAEALRRSGNELSNEGNNNGAELAGQAADRVERLGTYLEQKRGDELMRDIESFARRRPWLLAGIGMLAGMAAARFVKASSEQRYGAFRQTTGETGQQWPARSQLPAQTGGAGDPAGATGSEVGGLSDGPLARDPYAGAR